MLPFREDGTRVKTLCELCQNAVPNHIDRGCEWSIALKPVPNWEAISCWHSFGGKPVESFAVQKCPKYLPDPPRRVAIL